MWAFFYSLHWGKCQVKIFLPDLSMSLDYRRYCPLITSTYTAHRSMQLKGSKINGPSFSSKSLCMLVTQLCPTLCDPTRLLCPWDFPGKGTGIGYHFLLQGIFPTQGSNLGLLHCRQILFRLSYKIFTHPIFHVSADGDPVRNRESTFPLSQYCIQLVSLMHEAGHPKPVLWDNQEG